MKGTEDQKETKNQEDKTNGQYAGGEYRRDNIPVHYRLWIGERWKG